MKNKTKEITNYEVLKIIFRDYVYGIRYVRLLLIPVILSIFLARGLELFLSHQIGLLGECLKNGNSENYKHRIIVYIVCGIFSCFLLELQGYLFIGPTQRIFRECYRKSFEFFISLEFVEFSKIGCGAIHSAIERHASSLNTFIEQLFTEVIPTMVVITLDVFYVYYYLGLGPFLALSISLLILIISTIYVTIWRNKVRLSLIKDIDNASLRVYDSLSNHSSILSFDTATFETKRIDTFLHPIEKKYVKLYRVMYMFSFVQRILLLTNFGIILICGFYSIFMERIPNPLFITYITLHIQLANKLGKLGYVYHKFSQAFTDIKAYHRKVALIPPAIELNHKELHDFEKEIEFINVGYSAKDSVLQKAITFTLLKGEKVGIVGRNGVGKSTLIKVLLKFVNYTGTIRIDGEDINNVTRRSLRKLLGYIPQDSMLFNETVEYNIKYGNQWCSNTEMISKCKEMDTHNTFMRMNDGYTTIVGEYGEGISGGERQRVYMMRTVLKNAPILLLDEPTASLDKKMETAVLNTLCTKMHEKTIMVIIHNLSLLDKFDKILYLDDSLGPCEYGSYDTLMEKKGKFYDFYMNRDSVTNN
ncbi:ABC transporter B family member 25 [Astathelohania contejeani]|uniref:ABC transporter B family member 25 n=1 Tax=Astathelohania contejeani TaxID=164912 RepID=A0ABQ7HX67_9MICR|nr:ABC transporter B family member 25 [Thelohania contejeani]